VIINNGDMSVKVVNIYKANAGCRLFGNYEHAGTDYTVLVLLCL
jgi:hypothetical protein